MIDLRILDKAADVLLFAVAMETLASLIWFVYRRFDGVGSGFPDISLIGEPLIVHWFDYLVVFGWRPWEFLAEVSLSYLLAALLLVASMRIRVRLQGVENVPA